MEPAPMRYVVEETRLEDKTKKRAVMGWVVQEVKSQGE